MTKQYLLHCKICGHSFTSTEYGLFCSFEHMEEYQIKIYSKSYLKTRFRIFDRDDFTCVWCGRKPPEVVIEVDHVLPWSIFGYAPGLDVNNKEMYDLKDVDGYGFSYKGHQIKFMENLVTSCRDCNRGKGDYILKKYRESKKESE